MADHIDFLVQNGSFVLDADGFVETVDKRASIAQDIKHRIVEAELLVQLIAQRSQLEGDTVVNKIILEVDKDARLEPGTAQLQQVNENEFFLTAKTLEYGDTGVVLNV